MVGGIVCETIILSNRVWVNCRDREYECECAIYVPRSNESLTISEGDRFWWQGGCAYWTPYNCNDKAIGPEDIELKKISGSGVDKPRVMLYGLINGIDSGLSYLIF